VTHPREAAVALIVDPAFGDRLDSVAEPLSVWIADTPANRTAAERLRTRGARDITTFQVDQHATPETWCIRIIDVIELHHFPSFGEPCAASVRVTGAAPTPEVRAAFSACGLTEIEAFADGFRASTHRSAD